MNDIVIKVPDRVEVVHVVHYKRVILVIGWTVYCLALLMLWWRILQ